jgi:hypothetical protein
VRKTAVDDDIMKAEVDRAIASDSGADPYGPLAPPALDPAVEQGDRG